jgi:hypothetical protein
VRNCVKSKAVLSHVVIVVNVLTTRCCRHGPWPQKPHSDKRCYHPNILLPFPCQGGAMAVVADDVGHKFRLQISKKIPLSKGVVSQQKNFPLPIARTIIICLLPQITSTTASNVFGTSRARPYGRYNTPLSFTAYGNHRIQVSREITLIEFNITLACTFPFCVRAVPIGGKNLLNACA